MKKAPRRKKPRATKSVKSTVWFDDGWKVVDGELRPGRGRPPKVAPLFKHVAEKLPFACLEDIEEDLISKGVSAKGVYVAHDSMGTPRYIGRGAIFTRLKAHLKAHPRELVYFSFFVVRDKVHEREVETLLIRAAGDSLQFNERKKRIGIGPGNVRDFEPGTKFYERQRKRGKTRKKSARRQ